jgi:hypothetical protein
MVILILSNPLGVIASIKVVSRAIINEIQNSIKSLISKKRFIMSIARITATAKKAMDPDTVFICLPILYGLHCNQIPPNAAAESARINVSNGRYRYIVLFSILVKTKHIKNGRGYMTLPTDFLSAL